MWSTERARAATLALAILPLAGCLKGTPEQAVDDVDAGAPTEGGSIHVESCGYDVTTRYSATAPVVGTPVFGDDPTPRVVHLGLQGDARDSVVIQWRTVDETTRASTVELGEGTALDQTIEGLTYMYISGFNGNDGTVRMHEAHLCGLSPDTTYSYRVGGVDGDVEHWSPTYQFRTAPDPATQPDAEITLAFVGDSRDGYDIWAALVAEMQARDPDLILFSGDAVTIGAVQLEWETFFTEAEPLFATVPVISAHGNHDVNSINYYSQFAMPGDEENFAIDYGPMHLTVLNDTPLDVGDLRGKIRDFLEADLEASQDAPWNILMHHRPIYSASTNHGSDTTLRDEWGPLIDQFAVDVVLSGHDHDYERTKPMRGGAPQPSAADGTIYVVSGGAGASLYGNGTDTWTEYSEKTHSAVILELRPGSLDVTAFREDGSMIETFSIVKEETP
jgi:hypothetical protein